MAINNKNFWTQNPSRDPKRNSRFRVNFGSDVIWWAKSVDQPSFDIEETTHQYLIHTFKWPSNIKWKDVKMTVVDPVIPGSMTDLLASLQSSGYYIPSDPNSIQSSISKRGATNAFDTVGRGTQVGTGTTANMTIEVIDADGQVLHAWTLNNAWIKSITPSKLDYSNKDLMTIELSITYDWASYGQKAEAGKEVTLFDPGVASAPANLNKDRNPT